ncbi:plasmid segregation oscillating ATPase ParF [Limimonas halophila]|uniref:Plasmid segregation oscillating ATPase ParF n=1 Tax=Limimonas halophila TaxID=1082479 RepID=A0A1G7QPW8_9PROT|nr:ParA family partition ATPase [Limimonas halophila]SDF99909.1 plasmid segregation oscillating ATPase ParF [Limimonas halophila]
MAAHTIALAQQKGGAGKTTLAAHLAVALAEAGHGVAAVDTDPQGSLAGWGEVRAAADTRAPVTVHSVAGWRLGPELSRLQRGHDLVVIDSPPHAETDARAVIRAADLMVAPVQPSPLDVRATEPTLSLAADAGTPALVVLNRVPPRARLTDAMTDALGRLDVGLAATRIGSRVALAESLAEGLGVTESQPRGRAAGEVRALAEELFKRFG